MLVNAETPILTLFQNSTKTPQKQSVFEEFFGEGKGIRTLVPVGKRFSSTLNILCFATRYYQTDQLIHRHALLYLFSILIYN